MGSWSSTLDAVCASYKRLTPNISNKYIDSPNKWIFEKEFMCMTGETGLLVHVVDSNLLELRF